MIDLDFNDLLVGDLVEFTLDKNEDGQFIATSVQLLEDSATMPEVVEVAAPELDGLGDNEE